MNDVNENAASSSKVWHQKKNTRSSIEKSIAKIQNRLTETRLTHHNFEIFNVPYFETVFADVREKLSRQREDKMLDLGVSGTICGIFVSMTTKAAVHLGLVHNQEHRLRAAQDIVRCYARVDPGTRK